MDPRQELEELRRLDELERRASAANPERSFLGAVGEGFSNIVPQAGRWLGSRDLNPANIPEHLANAAQIPGALTKVAGGAMQMVREMSPPEYRGAAPTIDKTQAQAMGQALANRYGGKQQIYNTIATDPIGSLGDVASILAAPEALGLRGASLAGRTGEMLAKTSRIINPAMAPINATKVAGGAMKLGERLTSNSMGAVTGTSATAIREAAKAGAAGGNKAATFQANLRDDANPFTAVEDAKAALAAMHQQKGANYRTEILPISSDPTVLSFSGIEKAVKKVEDRGYYRGLSGTGAKVATKKEASEAWDKINKAVNDWKALDPTEYHTAEGMDQLKQSIGDIQQSLPYGSPARSAADAVYAAVKTEIVSQAPGYGKVMSDYEAASQALKDLERELSLNKKGNPGTAVRKLQSALRNNAATGGGMRTNMARELESAGADTMFPALAGQALSPNFARGLPGLGVGGAGLATVLASGANPAAIAAALTAAAATSPRLMGEAAYYAGKVGGTVGKFGGRRVMTEAEKLQAKMKTLGITPKNINKATLIAQMLAQPQEPAQ